MTRRYVNENGWKTYNLAYDAENRLTQATKNGTTVGTYVYDGDGNRVKATTGGETTIYIGNYFEWKVSSSTPTKYYYAGSVRVALRVGTTLYYPLNDHLGGTNVTTDSSGQIYSELRYKAFGETRYNSKSDVSPIKPDTPTTLRYWR